MPRSGRPRDLFFKFVINLWVRAVADPLSRGIFQGKGIRGTEGGSNEKKGRPIFL